MTTTNESSSYIDLPTLTSPTFSATAHANTLIHQTNNPNDTPLDLSTPLSRVLFDVQEVDTSIDTLTTQNALPIIQHTQRRSEAAGRVLENVEEQVKALNESYQRLEREVIQRHAAAEEVRVAAERMLRTLRLGRSVQRAVQLARQLEGQMDEVGRDTGAGAKGGKHWVMLPAANTVLSLRQLFGATGKGEENEGLGKVNVVTTLRSEIVAPSERQLLQRAQQVVREFSMSGLLASSGSGQHALTSTTTTGSTQTFAQTEDTKLRATNALQTLYLLSPTKDSTTLETFEPTLLISALQTYLQTALTSSLASLSRALATLPTLDKTLLEISARCQNIVALESLLSTIRPPSHPLLSSSPSSSQTATPANFLTPLLKHLDTSSLPSYFWRSMASQMSSRVQEILNRGGVSARTLRTNKEKVRDSIRECVDRGSRLPESALSTGSKKKGDVKVGGWEREAAVMVGAVVGPLQR